MYKPETALHDVIEKLCHDAGFHPKMSFEAFEERTVAGLVGAKFGVAIIGWLKNSLVNNEEGTLA